MDTENNSKSAKKNQKRKEKSDNKKSNEKVNFETPSELLERLKKEFEAAKKLGDQETVKTLRQKIWVLGDMIAGVKTDIPEKELCAIMQSLQLQNPLLSIASDVSCTNSKNADNDFKSEPEKRLRNLQKRLKQITELKTKLKNGEKLEMNQMEKIKSEAAVLEEIKELEDLIRSACS